MDIGIAERTEPRRRAIPVRCLKCGSENPDEKKFCRKCGASLSAVCRHCGGTIVPGDDYCGECGQALTRASTGTEKEGPVVSDEQECFTVLFSDLSGCAALSEELHPEEVKEIMSRVFGEIAQAATKHGGFVERFIDYGAAAFFGVPKAHEDDAIRAIRAALDIRQRVAALNREIKKRVGNPIAMRTGIHTEIMRASAVNLEKGRQEATKGVIDIASWLSTLVKAGEICVGPDTYRQAEGCCAFEALEPVVIEGQEKPVQAFKVLPAEEASPTLESLSGPKAEPDAAGERPERIQRGSAFTMRGESGQSGPIPCPPSSESAPMEVERKQVTLLFSDLSERASLSEKLDPDEVEEIAGRLLDALTPVVERYGGFVEKSRGHLLVGVFGVPDGHEDDPARAVRAAREMHELVAEMSPKVGLPVGTTLSMQSGINTGLVATDQTMTEKGIDATAGGTVDVASRLCSLAKSGEILIGPETYQHTEGCFECELLAPVELEKEGETIRPFRVLSPTEKNLALHCPSGIRTRFTGRSEEMEQLREAYQGLLKGKGGIISVIGDPGIGKSRLVEELRKTVTTPWLEGHAYPYTQNTPFSLVRSLLSDAFQIGEGDPSLIVREKIEKRVWEVTGDGSGIVPSVGNLYSLHYDELEQIAPEQWKTLLWSAVKEILSGLTSLSPTVVVFEDLQWADPSSVDLLRQLFVQLPFTCLFVCVHRPEFTLFTGVQRAALGDLHREICLSDLSSPESLQMVRSLLNTETIPPDLERFFEERVRGNPFYIEEVVDGLVDSGALIREGEALRLTKQMDAPETSSATYGAMGARLDRLEKEAKHVLQETSVTGRSFFYEYAMEEAHERCEQAYRIVSAKAEKTKQESSALIDILTNWAHALYYQGNFKKFLEVFTAHEREAAFLGNDHRSVMFHAWLGWAYCVSGKQNLAYEKLVKAKNMAEELGDRKGLGYALTWLSITAAFAGKLDEGLDAGRRAIEIGKSFPSDRYLFFKSVFAVAYVHILMGNLRSALAVSKALLDYGQKHSDHRSLTAGYGCTGLVKFYKGDVRSAVEYGEKSVGVARDPFYFLSWQSFLGGFYLQGGRTTEAGRELKEVINFDERFNVFGVAGAAYLHLTMLNSAKGQIGEGLKAIERFRDRCLADGNTWLHLMAEQLLGEVYLKMFEGGAPKSRSLLARNVPFLFGNLRFADGKAEEHLKEAIRMSTKIGAKLILGQTYLTLGRLHKAKKKEEKARECLSEAVKLLAECEADGFLRQAKEALEPPVQSIYSLGDV
jgi:class 3 adenylate cyclase/tetratricopeptide (TPR) repeat protein